jgi:hypothetical protein
MSGTTIRVRAGCVVRLRARNSLSASLSPPLYDFGMDRVNRGSRFTRRPGALSASGPSAPLLISADVAEFTFNRGIRTYASRLNTTAPFFGGRQVPRPFIWR